MAPRGRKPKPTHLRVIQGNPGRRPINDDEPNVEPALPMPPPELSDEAKVEWGRVSEELYNCGLLSKIDRAALAAYCEAYGTWLQASAAIAELAKHDATFKGLMIRTKQGNLIQNPLVGIRNKARADVVRYAAEFGMTPSARSRVSAKAPAEEQNPFAKFKRRK